MSTYSYTAYDAMGRVTAYNQSTTGAGTYSMSATYNLAGLMVDETYPSTKVIHTEYDDAGRVAGVKNAANTTYYAGSVASDSTNRIQYAEHGAVSAMKLGNNLWEKTTFNTRLQPTQIELGTSSTPSSIVQLDYTYGMLVGGTLDTTENNGNIQSQTLTVGSNIIKQSYTYDQVNRLLSAAETYNQAARWTQTYTFDQVGNRSTLTNSGVDMPLLPTQSTPAVSSSTNRISAAGYVYDNAGNLKDEPASLNKHYKYDAENRLVDFNSGATQYLYDGDGHRVKKITVGSQTTTTVFVYNAGGQLIAEYTSDPVPPAAGGGGTSYLTTDHLGSTRVVTGTSASQPVKARYDYLPYGEELPSSVGGRSSIAGYGGADSTRQKFTQKERDMESGLDYFGARYCSSPQGRFTGPDPYNIIHEAEDDDDFNIYVTNPQRWNRYSYVLNNPLRYVDPDGLYEYEAELLGKKIRVFISDSISKKEREQIKNKINDAIGIINNAADKLTAKQKDIIGNINNINVSDKINRSYTIEKTGTYNVVKSDILYSASRPDHPSAGWFASTIAHEGYHVELYKLSHGDLSKSRGLEAEKASNRVQREVGEKIGLAQYEIDYLKQKEANPGTRFNDPITKPPNTQPRERPRPPTRRSP